MSQIEKYESLKSIYSIIADRYNKGYSFMGSNDLKVMDIDCKYRMFDRTRFNIYEMIS